MTHDDKELWSSLFWALSVKYRPLGQFAHEGVASNAYFPPAQTLHFDSES
jgi:hypothetical protein